MGMVWRIYLTVLLSALDWPPCAADGDEGNEIPDKVGAEIHLSKKERKTLKSMECKLCKAILVEMYEEVVKHKMVKKSENEIWYTSNAICLGLLQKYRLD